jgi:hypothetical protein
MSKSNNLPKRKLTNERLENTSDEDDEVFFLVTYEPDKNGIVNFGIVSSNMVDVLESNPDKGILLYRKKKFAVDIKKRGTISV